MEPLDGRSIIGERLRALSPVVRERLRAMNPDADDDELDQIDFSIFHAGFCCGV